MLESSMNHYFEVKMEEIEAPFTAVGIGVIDNTCIGIRPLFLSPPPNTNYLISSEEENKVLFRTSNNGIGWFEAGHVWVGEQYFSAPPFFVGSRVGIFIDGTKKELQFYLNGKKVLQPFSYSWITREVHFVCSLNQDNRIRSVFYGREPPANK